MADNNLFTLRIITPDRVFFEGQVSMVEFNTTEGEIGIYKKHVPTTVIISPGILTITGEEGVKEAALHAGFVEILQDEVVILAEINGRMRSTRPVRSPRRPVRRKGFVAKRRKRIFSGQKRHCRERWLEFMLLNKAETAKGAKRKPLFVLT